MENIPCKHFVTERQSVPYGMGSATMEWPDCAHPTIEDVSEECSESCPGYEPCEVCVCEKHGEYLARDGCGGCICDNWNETQDLREEHPEDFR